MSAPPAMTTVFGAPAAPAVPAAPPRPEAVAGTWELVSGTNDDDPETTRKPLSRCRRRE